MNQETSEESQNADLDGVGASCSRALWHLRDPKGPQERKHVTKHALKQK